MLVAFSVTNLKDSHKSQLSEALVTVSVFDLVGLLACALSA